MSITNELAALFSRDLAKFAKQTYTTAPLAKDIEITWLTTATLYKTHPSFVRLPIIPR